MPVVIEVPHGDHARVHHHHHVVMPDGAHHAGVQAGGLLVAIGAFAFGFLLIGGSVLLISSLHAAAAYRLRVRTTTALAFAAAFAAMIFINYAIQTAFVPALVGQWSPDSGPVLAALPMANPRSLAWGIEMWGYALLGVATWLCAPVFAQGPFAASARWLCIVNGPISIAGGVLTSAIPGWVMHAAGYLAFGLWNIVIIALGIAAFLAARANNALGEPA